MVNFTIEHGISILLHTRTSIARKLLGTLGPSVVRVGRSRIVKGPCQAAELEALRFVARNTSIPVPQVRRTYTYHNHLFIELNYVKGADLEFACRRNLLSADQKKDILGQLDAYIHQLQGLNPPQEGNVASAESNLCVDYRIGTRLVGPFSTHEKFHSYLRGHIPLEDSGKVYGESVLRCHSNVYRTRFTHADLAQRNIIFNNGKIVAIIDWAFSGWYPEYWEYTKAHYGLENVPDWYSGLDRIMPGYKSELEAERSLWAQFDEPGNQMDWIRERTQVPSAATAIEETD